MPKVGNKTFPYTKEGMKQAKKEAKKTGLPIIGAVRKSRLKENGIGMKGNF